MKQNLFLLILTMFKRKDKNVQYQLSHSGVYDRITPRSIDYVAIAVLAFCALCYYMVFIAAANGSHY